MAEATSSTKKFKVNDRVRRATGKGCIGSVKELRSEITAAGKSEDKEKNLMLNIQWDNGTLSYLSPASVEIASDKGSK